MNVISFSCLIFRTKCPNTPNLYTASKLCVTYYFYFTVKLYIHIFYAAETRSRKTWIYYDYNNKKGVNTMG